jgi:hypothetical protein
MKKNQSRNIVIAMIFIVIFLALAPHEAISAEVQIQPYRAIYMNGDGDSSLMSATGFDVRLLSDIGIFVAYQFDHATLRYGGQHAANIDSNIFGIGYQYKFDIKKVIIPKFWLMGFYCVPSVEMQSAGQVREALHTHHMDLLPGHTDRKFDYYEYELHPDFGGEIGIGFDTDFSKTKKLSFLKNLSIGVDAAYRYLKMQEGTTGKYYTGLNPDGNKCQWWTIVDKDFSAMRIGVHISYKF